MAVRLFKLERCQESLRQNPFYDCAFIIKRLLILNLNLKLKYDLKYVYYHSTKCLLASFPC